MMREPCMMTPSFPSERKRVKGAEDRSPDLRLLQPPSQKRNRKGSPPVVSSGLPRCAERPWLKSCLHPVTQYDGRRGRDAHSCGAVAEFHRLPVHPGDCRGELHCSSMEQPVRMERLSMTTTFYNGDGAGSQNVRSSKCAQSKPDHKRRLGSRQADERCAKEGVVTPGRLELPTRSLGNCCSIHLSYGAIVESPLSICTNISSLTITHFIYLGCVLGNRKHDIKFQNTCATG